MFIDDERFPPKSWIEENTIIIRTSNEAEEYFLANPCPEFISFDHDLGLNSKTGYEIAKELIEYDMDECGKYIPKNFTFYVHSQNPVGKRHIEALLNNYLKVKDANFVR